jgi:hypothetical protein
VLSGVPSKGASYRSRLRLLLEIFDLLFLPRRLTVDGVLEPFDHGFEVLEALLQDLETRRVRVMAGMGSDARFLSARAELSRYAFEKLRQTPCPLNW